MMSSNRKKLRDAHTRERGISRAAHTLPKVDFMEYFSLTRCGVPHGIAKQYVDAGVPFDKARTYWLNGISPAIAIAWERRKKAQEVVV